MEAPWEVYVGTRDDVKIQVDKEMNSLLPFCKSVHFCASWGAHDMGKQQAEDTVVRSLGSGMELLKLTKPRSGPLIGLSQSMTKWFGMC
jgi:GTP-binding protein